MVFGGSQVLMDIEPLVRMIRHDSVVHGTSHTILGALVIGAIAGTAGRPITEFALRILHIPHRTLTWTVSFISSFVGTYSHILLDAVMHKDMHPLWPLSARNGLLGIMPTSWLYILCLATGALGLAIINLSHKEK